MLIVPSAPVSVGGVRAATCAGLRFATGGDGTLDLGIGLLIADGVGFFGGGGTAGIVFAFGGGGTLASLGGLAFGITGAGGATAADFGGARTTGGGGTAARFGITGGVIFGVARTVLTGGGAFTVGRTACGARVGAFGAGGMTVLRGAGRAAATVGRLGTAFLTVAVGAPRGAMVVRDANPFGRDSCDLGGAAGGASSASLVVGARDGVRPVRNIPGRVGSGPSFSRTLKSTITLGRLDPCGNTKYCCCASTGNAAVSNTTSVNPKHHD
jgi:hypothetical protein